MTPDKVKEAFDECAMRIQQYYASLHGEGRLDPQRFVYDLTDDETTRLQHALWMCEEGKAFVDAGRIEKAMRWLGFVQGAMWCSMPITIDELKQMNMPEPDAEARCRLGFDEKWHLVHGDGDQGYCGEDTAYQFEQLREPTCLECVELGKAHHGYMKSHAP